VLNASGGLERDLLAADPDYPMHINRDAQVLVTTGPEHRRLYDIASSINPGFAVYERKTTRAIPAIRLRRLPASG